MVMSPRLRKLVLTVHVVTSVGFPGAVACFLVLAVLGLTTSDVQVIRAAYLAMERIAWIAIIPLCFATLLTGIISSLGTNWGLFRYYWIVVKLLITIPSTAILLVHMRPIEYMADAAMGSMSGADLRKLQLQLILASAAAVLVLLVATALSVYKPRGLTRYGARKLDEQRSSP